MNDVTDYYRPNRGNQLHSCVGITKGFHSRSIRHSDEFNTRPSIQAYRSQNDLKILRAILKE